MHDIIIPESSELYKRLEDLAKFSETPESVIRRLIDAYKNNPVSIQDKSTYTKDIVPKKKITLEVIKEIYPRAKAVHEKRMDLDKALNELEDKLHRGSALMYINTFKAMRQGDPYKRTINTTATQYFLQQIYDDYKAEGLKLALQALNYNIDYFEKFIGAGNMKTTGEIRDKFTAELNKNLKERK